MFGGMRFQCARIFRVAESDPNVVYVGMFVFKELYLTAGLYALFIALAVVGWRDWSRTADALRASANPAS